MLIELSFLMLEFVCENAFTERKIIERVVKKYFMILLNFIEHLQTFHIKNIKLMTVWICK